MEELTGVVDKFAGVGVTGNMGGVGAEETRVCKKC